MTKQVQVRGAVTATQEARALATRELDVDTTLKRINLHDGSTPGGIPHLNYADDQNQTFTYAAASGTNTITISLAKAPASYAAGQRFTFKAANTITGSPTLNVNSLGAVTLKKKNVNGGSIDTLAAGDIIGDGIYTALVLDSSNALIESIDSGGIVSVSQGDLNTSTGTVSHNFNALGGGTITVSGDDMIVANAAEYVTFPGGQYGFMLETLSGASGTNAGFMFGNSTTSYAQRGCAFLRGPSLNVSVSGQQRYVTSSPPFDHGDGETGGYIFLLLDKQGRVAQHYMADVPPWAYNGPTNIRADHQCPITKKKYRKAMKKRTLEQIMDGAEVEFEYEEITQEVKNADVGVIPHPFGNIRPDFRVVLIDPMDERLRRLMDYQNAGGGFDLAEAIHSGKIRTEDKALVRKGPAGVKITPLLFK